MKMIKLTKKEKMDIPKNPFKKDNISDKEFKEAILEDRLHRKKRYGSIWIMR